MGRSRARRYRWVRGLLFIRRGFGKDGSKSRKEIETEGKRGAGFNGSQGLMSMMKKSIIKCQKDTIYIRSDGVMGVCIYRTFLS